MTGGALQAHARRRLRSPRNHPIGVLAGAARDTLQQEDIQEQKGWRSRSTTAGFIDPTTAG